MAVPVLLSSINFPAASPTVSGTLNLNQGDNRRLITCTVPSVPIGGLPEQAGYLWTEVRTDQLQFVRVDTKIILTGVETGQLLLPSWTGVIWRIGYEPVQWLSPRTGVFRFYTI